MDFNILITGLFTILLLPLQMILAPIDFILNAVPGIEIIPATLTTVTGVIGSLPETLVSIAGIHPLLWNASFLVFIAYIGLTPTINLVKKLWAWIRP